eukprot:636356-Pleurochrysis_carterae.AAC.5
MRTCACACARAVTLPSARAPACAVAAALRWHTTRADGRITHAARMLSFASAAKYDARHAPPYAKPASSAACERRTNRAAADYCASRLTRTDVQP